MRIYLEQIQSGLVSVHIPEQSLLLFLGFPEPVSVRDSFHAQIAKANQNLFDLSVSRVRCHVDGRPFALIDRRNRFALFIELMNVGDLMELL